MSESYWTRVARNVALLLLLAAAAACYSYVPVDSQVPAPSGRYVELQITDRGRVGLGDRFGAGIRQINGTVVSQEGNNLVLAVDRVTNIEGEMDRWAGETTSIDRDFVGGMMTRQFSASRTSLLAGAVAAVVYATAASGLLSSGSEKDEDPAGPTNQSNRIPVHRTVPRDIQLRLWRIHVP